MREMRKNVSNESKFGLQSIIRNRKLVTTIGIALIAVGVWGMVSIGADALEAIRVGEYSDARGAEFQYAQYVFMFTMIAGLIMLVFSSVSMQAANARARLKTPNL